MKLLNRLIGVSFLSAIALTSFSQFTVLQSRWSIGSEAFLAVDGKSDGSGRSESGNGHEKPPVDVVSSAMVGNHLAVATGTVDYNLDSDVTNTLYASCGGTAILDVGDPFPYRLHGEAGGGATFGREFQLTGLKPVRVRISYIVRTNNPLDGLAWASIVILNRSLEPIFERWAEWPEQPVDPREKPVELDLFPGETYRIQMGAHASYIVVWKPGSPGSGPGEFRWECAGYARLTVEII